MKYLEFSFKFEPNNEIVSDVLMAVLADVGFESFVNESDILLGYIQQNCYSEEDLKQALLQFPIEVEHIEYQYEEAEDKNWNEEWEKNFFQPIIIDNLCAIHSTFHKDIPPVTYDIVINPQMAFGTGHHETTSLIINELLHTNLKDKALLDMGCGTSILAILAHKRGAKPITAIDIDTWCVDNSIDNCKLNNTEDILVELGDANSLKDKGPFDFIIANINRNILLQDMDKYAEVLKTGGQLLMSGFYTEDITLLEEKGKSLGLHFSKTNNKNNWACLLLEKR